MLQNPAANNPQLLTLNQNGIKSGIAWQQVIEMMKKVPNSNPNYEAAQQKIIDYQKYINYAQKAVNNQNIN